jgi:hypothetical protein
VGTSCKDRERLQESPFWGPKKYFLEGHSSDEGSDLRRPKLADSSWTPCCNGFLSLVSCPQEMSTLPVLWAGAEMLNLLKSQHPKMNDSAVWFYENEVPTDQPIFNYDGKIRF